MQTCTFNNTTQNPFFYNRSRVDTDMQICTTGTVHDDVQQPGEQSDDGDVEQPDHWLSNERDEQHSGSNESDDEV